MIEDANEEGQAIVVIHGKVYDCTDFLPKYPGGAEVITDIDAVDFEEMDEEFDEHSEESVEDMRFLYVGELATEEQEALAAEGEELPQPPREARTLKAIFQSIPDMEDMYESDDEEGSDDGAAVVENRFCLRPFGFETRLGQGRKMAKKEQKRSILPFSTSILPRPVTSSVLKFV